MLLSTKSRLDFVRHLSEVARTRIRDEEFGEFFSRSVSRDVEEADFLLDSFVQFLSCNTPLRKRGTVHRLIEEVSKKYQLQLEGKGIRLSKQYERDLPETIVPDDLLSYILDSIFQYGIKAVTPGGDMEFSTKSSRPQKDFRFDRYVEIKLLLRASEKPDESSVETPIQEESWNLMLLRLAQEVVRKNQGIMKLDRDEKQRRISISLSFPSDRRENVYYQPI